MWFCFHIKTFFQPFYVLDIFFNKWSEINICLIPFNLRLNMYYILRCQVLIAEFVSEQASVSQNVLANLFCLLTLTVTLKIAFCSFQAAFIFHPKWQHEWITKTKTWTFGGILEQVAANPCSQTCPLEWHLSRAGSGTGSWDQEKKKKKALTRDNRWSAQSKTCF